ncbi:hypothetical protein [Pseudoalteromonas xiamenensis]|uniref:Uncharacterized protein n=1 Tax=Pseudoalteromonas xiamenensis TaxID=882626 RepID=A0A975HMU5_9GAMM|nr:hypothetical protein [Pseudoalteromonas xiamenensis]QTH73478.1 hypothetical protein J5O05_18465 [Pseudoalteromonas xiamenensis]
MKSKIILFLVAAAIGQVLIPPFASTSMTATLINSEGESVKCEFNWSGVGFGKSLSDGKLEECISKHIKEGYVLSSNEKTVEQKTILNWLVFG